MSVTVLPTSLGSSLAATGDAQRTESAEKRKKDPVHRTPDEAVILELQTVQAVRSAKGNAQEEGREDREERGLQQPRPDSGERLDLKA